MHYDYDYDNDKKWVLQSCIFTGQKIHVVKMLGHLSTYFLMKNLNFWSKIVMLRFWSRPCLRLLRPCRNLPIQTVNFYHKSQLFFTKKVCLLSNNWKFRILGFKIGIWYDEHVIKLSGLLSSSRCCFVSWWIWTIQ